MSALCDAKDGVRTFLPRGLMTEVFASIQHPTWRVTFFPRLQLPLPRSAPLSGRTPTR